MADTPIENQNGAPTKTPEEKLKQELADLTGISSEKITPEMIEKYKFVKAINAKLDFLAVKSEQDQAKKVIALTKLFEARDTIEEVTALETKTAVSAAAVAETATQAPLDTPTVVANWLGDKIEEKTNSFFGNSTSGEKSSGLGEKLGELIKKFIPVLAAIPIFGGKFLNWVKSTFGWENPTPISTPPVQNPTNSEPTPQTPVVPTPSPVESQEREKTSSLYPAAFTFITELSGEKRESNIGTSITSKGFAHVTYQDFLENYQGVDFKKKILGENSENVDAQKEYTDVSRAWNAENTKSLLRIGLSSTMVERLITGEKEEKWKEKFGAQRYDYILNLIKSGEYSYSKLTFYEISLLYIATVPAIGNAGFFALKSEIAGGIGTLIGGENMQQISETLKQDSFSPELISALSKSGSFTHGTLNLSLEEMKQKLGLTNPKDISDFEKLFAFKEYIMGTGFLNNPKIGLSDSSKKTFIDHLDYTWISALYFTCGGMKIEDINPVNLVAIYSLVYKIIATSNDASDTLTAANWISEIAKKSILPFSENPIFSPEEKTVMSIYAQRLIDILVTSHMRWMYSVLGPIGVNENNLGESALILGVTGAGLKYAGGKGIAKAIEHGKLPFFSKWVNRAGWLALGSAVVLGGLSIAENSQEGDVFSKDLENAYNKADIDAVLKILEEHKNAVNHYVNTKGESINVVSYKDEIPFVMYNGNLYQIQLINTQNSLQDTSTWEFLKGVGLGMAAISEEVSIDGKNLYPISIQSGKIQLGQTGMTFDFAGNLDHWEKRELTEDVVSKIDALVKEIDPDLKFWNSGEKKEIFIAGKIPNSSFMIGLVPISQENT